MNLYKNLQCPHCLNYHPDNFANISISGAHKIIATMQDRRTTAVVYPFLCKSCGTIFISKAQLLDISEKCGNAGLTKELTITEPAGKTAKWLNCAEHNDHMHAVCSNCGFMEEAIRVVETGKSSDDYVKVKWNYCPKCGSKMSV